ncbi:hypothetical protein Calag_1051 [Caldisphaera lagunensis DSM 15908]|uniref:Threonine efflux protein n=2 Tax=Caldisphaera lagunensis TaxID=200415 RepID=L0AA42_CALLD|nr:hypothetical protein Calag_1051 [Caldisphaera lagunensis DSM 15908]
MNIMDLILIISIILIASIHMIAPDHWMPLTVLSIKRSYSLGNIVFISALIGFLHSFISIIISLLILYLGLSLLNFTDLKYFSLALIFIVCIYFLVGLFKERKESNTLENSSLMVSILPDPAIIPFIINSSILGMNFLIFSIILFISISSLALAFISVLVNRGIIKALSKLKPYYADYLIIIILIITAIYILFE